MSFLIVTLDRSCTPALASHFRPLRLGGPEGVVATYVKKLGAAAESPWHLTEADIIGLAGADSANGAVFFRSGDGSDGESVGFCRLASLHGTSTNDRTDLVCHFTQITARPLENNVWSIEELKRGTLCESISLSGGITRGKWQWTDSPMSLGAAVVGGTCIEGGCGSSEPHACCGSCH